MTNEPKAGKGLDPEMLAAYIDNRLPPEQRASVEAQLANDPDSYAVLVETMKALDDGSVPEALGGGNPPRSPVEPVTTKPIAVVVPMPTRGSKTRWMVAASALAAAAILVMVVRLQPTLLSPSGDTDADLVSLVKAADGVRRTQGRLSGGFQHAPLRPTRGRVDSIVSPDDWDLAAVVRAVEEAPSGQGPRREQVLGVGYLLLGRTDAAVSALQSAAQANPNDATVQSDFATALLERASVTASGDDLRAALSAFDRSLAIDSSAPEALFGRAMALELLHDPAAVQAWERYLAVDPSSAWAEEASQRLAALKGARSLK